MTFRTPLTSASAVDTGPAPSSAGVKIYQAGTGLSAAGVVEFRDGIVGDDPSRLVASAFLTPQGGSFTEQGGGFSMAAGSWNNVSGPRLDLNVEDAGGGGYTSVARLKADAFYLGSKRVATVGAGWTYPLRNPSYNYGVPGGGWQDMPGGNLTVTVPDGYTLDVEWFAPRITVSSNGGVDFRMLMGGAAADGIDFSTGGGASLFAPASLRGSVAGTGVGVLIQVQANLVAGTSSVVATAGGFVTLRYRIY